MKSKETLRNMVLVLAVAAILLSCAGFARAEILRQQAVTLSNALLAEAERADALAQRLGQSGAVWIPGAQPVRTEAEDTGFTAGLVAWVDAQNDENRLYAAVGSLNAQLDASAAGETYAAIIRAAEREGHEDLARANHSAVDRMIACGVLLAAGLLGLGAAILAIESDRDSERAQPEARAHRGGRQRPAHGLV